MIPQEFDYHTPGSLAAATELLASQRGAKLLAGGMSLIPAMKHRLALPSTLIDLGGVAELSSLEPKRGRLEIGAMVTHAALAAEAPADLHVLGETAAVIGDVQVRNRGTLGGSLVHADPAADWPATFLALDGEAVLLGPRGERTVPASDFFRGMLTSAAEPDEILTRVRVSFERKRFGTAYAKLRQPASGFALVGVAAAVSVDRRGRVADARIGVTGINPVPFRARSLESKLEGQEPDEARLGELCREVEECDAMDDLHASAEYRRHLLGVYARRAISSALERARS